VGWYWSARYADETRVTPPIAQQEVVAQPVDPATPPGQPAGHTPQPRATALVVVPEETVAVPKEVLMVQEATLVKETEADPGEVADSKVPPPTVVVAATDTAIAPAPQRLTVAVVPDGLEAGAPPYAPTSPKSEGNMGKWDVG